MIREIRPIRDSSAIKEALERLADRVRATTWGPGSVKMGVMKDLLEAKNEFFIPHDNTSDEMADKNLWDIVAWAQVHPFHEIWTVRFADDCIRVFCAGQEDELLHIINFLQPVH